MAIDVGGTGLKASVLDAAGKLMTDRVRVRTTYPCPPERLVDMLATLVAPLPAVDRVSVGFPGVVRKGIVLRAPDFVTRSGPELLVAKKLLAAWTGFDLAGAMAARLGHPVRVANDADSTGAPFQVSRRRRRRMSLRFGSWSELANSSRSCKRGDC